MTDFGKYTCPYNQIKRAHRELKLMEDVAKDGQLTVAKSGLKDQNTCEISICFDQEDLPRVKNSVHGMLAKTAQCIIYMLWKHHMATVCGSQRTYAHQRLFAEQMSADIDMFAHADVDTAAINWFFFNFNESEGFKISAVQLNRARKGLKDELLSAQDENSQKMLAFCQGMHARLGDMSHVRLIYDQVAEMVMTDHIRAVLAPIFALLE